MKDEIRHAIRFPIILVALTLYFASGFLLGRLSAACPPCVEREGADLAGYQAAIDRGIEHDLDGSVLR